jgi:integrase/recombinase XerD
MSNTILLPFQPDAMTPAQLAAVSYLARYSGHTHQLYAYQLRRWFAWCETNRLDPWSGFSGPTSSCSSDTSARTV